MKKILLSLLMIICFISCSYHKTCKMDIEYQLHYPDTTITYKETYNIDIIYLFKDYCKEVNESTIKPELSSHRGSNYILIPHYGEIGPKSTAPISIKSYRVYDLSEIK